MRLKEETVQSPHGIAVNSEGLIAVADQEKHRILIIDMEGNCVRKVGCYGKSVGQLNRPTDVTYLNDDNILVADQLNHRIQQFNVQTGNFVKSFGKKGTRCSTAVRLKHTLFTTVTLRTQNANSLE